MTKTEWDLLNLQLGQLVEGLNKVHGRLDHLDGCVDGAKDSIDDLKTLLISSVPNGDFEGHRQAHKQMMVNAQRWGDIKGGAIKKAVEWAVVGALVLTVTAVWEYIKRGGI